MVQQIGEVEKPKSNVQRHKIKTKKSINQFENPS